MHVRVSVRVCICVCISVRVCENWKIQSTAKAVNKSCIAITLFPLSFRRRSTYLSGYNVRSRGRFLGQVLRPYCSSLLCGHSTTLSKYPPNDRIRRKLWNIPTQWWGRGTRPLAIHPSWRNRNKPPKYSGICLQRRLVTLGTPILSPQGPPLCWILFRWNFKGGDSLRGDWVGLH